MKTIRHRRFIREGMIFGSTPVGPVIGFLWRWDYHDKLILKGDDV